MFSTWRKCLKFRLDALIERRSRHTPNFRWCPHIETLEDRATPAATITVNSTADTNLRDMVLTLREAILVANGDLAKGDLLPNEQAQVNGDPAPLQDTITFNIPGTGVQTINLAKLLPEITDRVTIDGYGQPGSKQNTLDNGDNAVLLIQLTGNDKLGYGLKISAGDSTVQGLVINGFSDGDAVDLREKGGNQILGNFIGTDTDGEVARANFIGVRIVDSPNNYVGGTFASLRNVISGNRHAGIVIEGAKSVGNRVQGNFIGTDKDGTEAVPNRFGVGVTSGSGNLIGGTVEGARNVISGNLLSGVNLEGTSENKVQGNYIGIDVTGTTSNPDGQPNTGDELGNGDGITILESNKNIIGGVTAMARNIISGNTQVGIRIDGAASTENLVQGNYIGTDWEGKFTDKDGKANSGDELGNRGGGIYIVEASKNTIGGDIEAARNLISGNIGHGIWIRGRATDATKDATQNKVFGNYIGLNVDGDKALANTGAGVYVDRASANIIGAATGLAGNTISGNAYGVQIEGTEATGNLVQANYIGTDLNGIRIVGADGKPLGNALEGVLILRATKNQIGGIGDEGNVISGNGYAAGEPGGNGVRISLSHTPAGVPNNVVQGNFIGTDWSKTEQLPNGRAGVMVEASSRNQIRENSVYRNGQKGIDVEGQPNNDVINNEFIANDIRFNEDDGIYLASGSGNVIDGNTISDNTGDGIEITGITATDNYVQGNYIGTDATGADLGNLGHGVLIGSGASDNVIGQTVPEAINSYGISNTIAFNDLAGVAVLEGTGNTILSNSIHDNGELGIDLGNDGVTANDTLDPDGGPNLLQNYPILTLDKGTATLDSTPNTEFLIQFFSNTTADPSGHGEGETLISSFTVTTDSKGQASFSGPTSELNAATATAVSKVDGAYLPVGDTSEFSGFNHAPIAADDSYTMNEDTSLSGNVLANDSDADGDLLTAILVWKPTYHLLVFNSDGTFTYTPGPDFHGTYSFTYMVFDGRAFSNVATVTITVNPVNDAPTAENDSYSTMAGLALDEPAPGVLENDSDREDDPLTAVLVQGPAHGTLIFNANGSFIYVPDAGYTGTDTFTYRASDGALESNIATVTIDVYANPP